VGVQRLDSVQLLRGIAASLVFVFHLVVTVDRYSPADLRHWVEFGNFGVDLFFVISGFVMAHSVRHLAGPRDACAFMAGRIWRIVPLLYFVTILCIAFAALRGQSFEMGRLINSLAIFPIAQTASKYSFALIPAWTLAYEMAFYLVVAAAVALRWPRMALIALVLLTSLFNGLMLEFAFGIAAYELWTRRALPNPTALVVLAVLCLMLAATLPRPIAWGVPAFLLFCAILHLQPSGRVGAIGSWFGAISYSLYLTHVVSFDAIAPIFAPLGLIPLGCALTGFGLLIAWLVYEAIEAPLWRHKTASALKLAANAY
jgi:exopolysaccharide production protein ExoZ